MSRFSRWTPALCMALGCMLAFGSAAQSPQSTQAPQSSPKPPADAAAPDPKPAEGTGESFPVFAVTSVEVLRSSRAPALDIVVANGLAGTDHWSGATLVPLSRGAPTDGVLDLVLTAQPPLDSGEPSGHGEIQAILPLAAEHPFKAIRVRSANNAVLLRTLPGVAEAKPPAEVCGSCVGKRFLAKGVAAPAGAAADQLVLEEDLPPHTRIIRPTDGISDMRANPNRLTVVIGEDGRIIDAAWE